MEVFLINNETAVLDLPPPEAISAAAAVTGHMPQDDLPPFVWVPLMGVVRVAMPLSFYRNKENRNMRPACLTVTLSGKSADGGRFYSTSEFVWTTMRYAAVNKLDPGDVPELSRDRDKIFEKAKSQKLPHLDFRFTIKLPSTLPPTSAAPTSTLSSPDMARKDPLLAAAASSSAMMLTSTIAHLDPNLAAWQYPSYEVSAALLFESFAVQARQMSQNPVPVVLRCCYPPSWVEKAPPMLYRGKTTGGIFTYSAEIQRITWHNTRDPVILQLTATPIAPGTVCRIERIDVACVRRYKHSSAAISVYQASSDSITQAEQIGSTKVYKPPFLSSHGIPSTIDFELMRVGLRVPVGGAGPDAVIGDWRLEHYAEITIFYKNSTEGTVSSFFEKKQKTLLSVPLRISVPGVWDNPNARDLGFHFDPVFVGMPPPPGWHGHDQNASLNFAVLLKNMWGDVEQDVETNDDNGSRIALETLASTSPVSSLDQAPDLTYSNIPQPVAVAMQQAQHSMSIPPSVSATHSHQQQTKDRLQLLRQILQSSNHQQLHGQEHIVAPPRGSSATAYTAANNVPGLTVPTLPPSYFPIQIDPNSQKPSLFGDAIPPRVSSASSNGNHNSVILPAYSAMEFPMTAVLEEKKIGGDRNHQFSSTAENANELRPPVIAVEDRIDTSIVLSTGNEDEALSSTPSTPRRRASGREVFPPRAGTLTYHRRQTMMSQKSRESDSAGAAVVSIEKGVDVGKEAIESPQLPANGSNLNIVANELLPTDSSNIDVVAVEDSIVKEITAKELDIEGHKQATQGGLTIHPTVADEVSVQLTLPPVLPMVPTVRGFDSFLLDSLGVDVLSLAEMASNGSLGSTSLASFKGSLAPLLKQLDSLQERNEFSVQPSDERKAISGVPVEKLDGSSSDVVVAGVQYIGNAPITPFEENGPPEVLQQKRLSVCSSASSSEASSQAKTSPYVSRPSTPPRVSHVVSQKQEHLSPAQQPSHVVARIRSANNVDTMGSISRGSEVHLAVLPQSRFPQGGSPTQSLRTSIDCTVDATSVDLTGPRVTNSHFVTACPQVLHSLNTNRSRPQSSQLPPTTPPPPPLMPTIHSQQQTARQSSEIFSLVQHQLQQQQVRPLMQRSHSSQQIHGTPSVGPVSGGRPGIRDSVATFHHSTNSSPESFVAITQPLQLHASTISIPQFVHQTNIKQEERGARLKK